MDIVEKLRQDAWLSRATKDKAEHERAKLPSEAADDIERLRSALRQVAKPGYGLQGIDEDHGHDPNAYNYHAMIYWKSQAEQMQIAARSALNF